jgi:hypothetical protein
METMRIKRQPRAKRQKTTRETSQTCEPSPDFLSKSLDISNESQYTGSSAAVSPTSATPMNGVSPQYAPQFHTEPEQSLPPPQHVNAPGWNTSNFNQHRANTTQWSSSDFNHSGNIHHPLPYSVPPLTQQTFPFTLPSCSPSAGQVSASSPANIEQYYANQTQSPTQLDFNSISISQGLVPISEVKMASQPASAYSMWTEDQRWESTPTSYSQY